MSSTELYQYLNTMYGFTLKSSNGKLGTSFSTFMSAEESCPTSCPFKKKGCYGDNFPLSLHWGKVDLSWTTIMHRLAGLPMNSNVRFHVVGDYHEGMPEVKELTRIVKRKRLNVISFTHRLPTPEHVAIVKAANYVINFSTEVLSKAKECLELGVNAVIAISSSETRKYYKEDGVNVVVCPAQLLERMNCEQCMLCSQDRVSRKIVVGFLAHGTKKKLANATVLGEQQ